MTKYKPRKVVLKPYILQVRYTLKNGNLGEYDPTNISIEMKKGLKDQQIKSSLLHEVIHHTLEPMTFLKSDEEESICRVMERMLLSLIKDNPKLIAWIQEDDQP